jgi:hypothetical protein
MHTARTLFRFRVGDLGPGTASYQNELLCLGRGIAFAFWPYV